jgi:hypothetical protein
MLPVTRRQFCRITSLSSVAWMAANHFGLADVLNGSGRAPNGRAKALIMLWMGGGPSQLETFDPKPNAPSGILGDTKAIETSVKGVLFGEGLPNLAEQMHHLALIRSMISKEGDHERGTYLMKTGYRPDPTVVHPAIGAICAAELPEDKVEIPRYISILSGDRVTRGGYLGEQYDAFRTFDPRDPLTDLTSHVPEPRRQQRIADLDVIENSFARRYPAQSKRALHRETVQRALKMMSSEQLQAFRIEEEPAALRDAYGDTPFGRGCLVARRLIEVGVRCVEVALNGWDTHVKNYSGTATQTKILDPAFATLIRDLHERKLLDSTLVLCTGEFGRTPRINPAAGRDHWPTGFSLALAGGGIRGGQVIGETDPNGSPKPKDPVSVDDLYATVLAAMGINPAKSYVSPIGRPMKLSEGAPLSQLIPG